MNTRIVAFFLMVNAIEAWDSKGTFWITNSRGNKTQCLTGHHGARIGMRNCHSQKDYQLWELHRVNSDRDYFQIENYRSEKLLTAHRGSNTKVTAEREFRSRHSEDQQIWRFHSIANESSSWQFESMGDDGGCLVQDLVGEVVRTMGIDCPKTAEGVWSLVEDKE